MHILADDQKRGRKNRTGAERILKRLNSVVLVAQLGCLLVTISYASIAAGKTFKSSLWFPQEYELETVLELKTKNCTYNEIGSHFGFGEVNTTITHANQGLFMAEAAELLRATLVVNGVAVVLGSVNKLLFDLNVFDFRYRHLVLHKELISVLELGLLIWSLVSAIEAEAPAKLMRNYLKHCGVSARSSIFYVPPFAWLYTSISLTLFIHLVTICLHLRNALKKPPRLPGPYSNAAGGERDSARNRTAPESGSVTPTAARQ